MDEHHIPSPRLSHSPFCFRSIIYKVTKYLDVLLIYNNRAANLLNPKIVFWDSKNSILTWKILFLKIWLNESHKHSLNIYWFWNHRGGTLHFKLIYIMQNIVHVLTSYIAMFINLILCPKVQAISVVFVHLQCENLSWYLTVTGNIFLTISVKHSSISYIRVFLLSR